MLLFLVALLLGKLFLNNKLLSFIKFNIQFEWFEYTWIGLAAVIAILQIWSIFLPVNIYSLIFITSLALASAVLWIRKGIKIPKIGIFYLLIIGFLLFIISYFASLSVYWPDTQGYHLNAVKWANLYPVVPGLANLHTRLGFNSSFFLFASMIDSVLKDRSSHIAISFVASILLAEYIWLFMKSKNKHLKIFMGLTIPAIIVNIIRTGQISSLSYDFVLLLLILAICIEVIKNTKKSLFTAGIVSIILLTVKLSGAVFSIVVMCFVLCQLVLKKRKNFRVFWIFLILGISFILPYIIRNIILTGWPFYPLPLFEFNLSWTVPFEKVKELFDVIKAWAILPGEGYVKMMGMPIWGWFPGWVTRNIYSFELQSFIASLLVFILLFAFKMVDLNTIKKNMGLFILVLTSVVSILYLIISAPDFRFGGIFFWIFFASIFAFFFTKIFSKYPKLEKIFFVVPLFLIYNIAWPPKFEGGIMLKSIRWEQAWTFDKTMIVPSDGTSSFEVYIPGETGSCGNSKLPCTPEYKNDFKEIVPGDLSEGFAPGK